MHAADRLEFAPPSAPGQVRAFGLAVLAHAFLLAALTWGVHWKSEPVSTVAEAELWSAVPQQAAPKLVEVAPEPSPPVPEKQATPVPPPPTPDADIALQRQKARQALERKQELEKQRLEKLKQEKLLLEKKREQELKAAEAKKALEDKKKAALDSKRKEAALAQQEAKKLELQRQENIKRMTGLAGATGASNATGTAQRSSGPSASYAGRIRAIIKPNIVFTDEIAGNPTAEVEVKASPTGSILSRNLLKSSGVTAWDDAVIKAIDKTAVLPRDVDGRVPTDLIISFRPKD
jgi:colicin import membrane protein